jgi:hypothetical protein
LRRGKIYATTPNNEYQYLQGTSMAAPNRWSCCFDSFLLSKLTAKQVKYILMESGVAITTDVIVGGKECLQHYPNLVKCEMPTMLY